MAYAQTTPVFGPPVQLADGTYQQRITFDETDAAAASEWSVEMPRETVKLVSYKATLTAGTGTTIGPAELGRATGWTSDTQEDIATSTAAADAHVNDQTELILPLGSDATLYGRSMVDAAADNAISTELIIEYGVA